MAVAEPHRRARRRRPMTALAFATLGEIFAPLEELLATGGDTRLRLDPATRLNGYGCRPYPRPEAITFASSTATSISERAYARAEAERGELIRAGLRHGLDRAIDERLERLRHELRGILGLAGDTEIVFSPSGTDSTLHAVYIARAALGAPMVSIVVAADETGSGVAAASCGRHFSTETAHGVAVIKGDPILGLGEDLTSVALPRHDADGRTLSHDQMDAAVSSAVSRVVMAGNRVLLHVMDHSKLGARCPSRRCLRDLRGRWGAAVQVVVDACQMRLGRRRLAWHLAQGHLVLVTGSKFFTGPPFCGALLVPASLSAPMSVLAMVPEGLCDYSGRSDWPLAWRGVRAKLRERINLGQLLRWVAALEEMRAYFAVPDSFRMLAFAQFAASVTDLIAGRENLALLPDDARSERGCGDEQDDGEMAARTIFPFVMRQGGRLLSPAEAHRVYRALNDDVSALLPSSASPGERQLAATLCHIGQPVAIDGPDGATAALRISAGARIASESWGDAGEDAALSNLRRELEQVRRICDKIDLLLRHLAALDGSLARPTAVALPAGPGARRSRQPVCALQAKSM
jgi:hypothetical protein